MQKTTKNVVFSQIKRKRKIFHFFYLINIFENMEQSKIHFSAEDKLKKRLAMSYEERYKSALKFIRFMHQMKNAKISKPEFEHLLTDKKNGPK